MTIYLPHPSTFQLVRFFGTNNVIFEFQTTDFSIEIMMVTLDEHWYWR